MSWTDRISMLIAAGAIVATLGVGTCSTNARFNDVNSRFNDVNRRFNDVNRRFNDVNSRFDDVNRRFDDVQADIRELRSLVIEAIKGGTSTTGAADAPAS